MADSSGQQDKATHSRNEHVEAAKRGVREDHPVVQARSHGHHMTAIFPQETGVTPAPARARRLVKGRGNSVTAEWPVKDASGLRQKPEAAGPSLRRPSGLAWSLLPSKHVPDGSCFGSRYQRQPFARVALDGESKGFTPLSDEGILAFPRSYFSGSKAEDGHHRPSPPIRSYW
jgi:hypothetical protein